MLDEFKDHPEALVAEIATGAEVIAQTVWGERPSWDTGPWWLGGRALHDAAQAFCDVIPFFEAELKVSTNGSSDLPRSMLTEQVAELALQIRGIFHDAQVSLPLAFLFTHFLLHRCGYRPVGNPSAKFIQPDRMSNPEFGKLIHERWRRPPLQEGETPGDG
jgi:hypothetical protein